MCSWLFKRRSLLATHGLRHHLEPRVQLSTWTVWHHGGSRGPPAAEALLPAARPLQPYGGPHTALVSEPGGIQEGGREGSSSSLVGRSRWGRSWDLRWTWEDCPNDTSAVGMAEGDWAEGGVGQLGGVVVLETGWTCQRDRSRKRKKTTAETKMKKRSKLSFPASNFF